MVLNSRNWEAGSGGEAIRQEIIRVLADHKRWRLGVPEAKRADLRQFDLAGWTMDGVDLSSAIMTGVSMRRSSLVSADLQGAELANADLEGAQLNRANLKGADLRGARLGNADLTEARMEGAGLERSEASEDAPTGRPTDLTNAILPRSTLWNADLTDCDMTGADLTDADVGGADLRGGIMVNAILEGLRADDARFGNVNVFGAEMDASLHEIVLEQGGTDRLAVPDENMDEVIAAHREWLASEGQRGKRCEFDMTDLSGQDLAGVDFTSVILRRCDLRGADFRGAALVLGDLSNSELARADLSGSDLRGCVLRRANLREANLGGTRMGLAQAGDRDWPTNLERASLHGAIFDGARLELPTFRATRISTATVSALREAGVPASLLRDRSRIIVEQ